MQKKRAALSYFVTLTVLIILVFVFSFVSFTLPTTIKVFNGFLNSFASGTDFAGGVSAVYQVEKDFFEGTDTDATNATLNRLAYLLDKNYHQPKIYQLEDNQIKIIVPGDSINLNYLVGSIEFSTEDLSQHDHDHGHDHDHDDHDHSEHVPLTGQHIKFVEYRPANGVPTVWIEFTAEGKDLLKEATHEFSSSSEGTIYLYADKDYANPLLQVQLNSQIDTGYIQLSGGSLTTKANANEVVNKVQSGRLGTNMKLVGKENHMEQLISKSIVVIVKLLLLVMVALSFAYLYLKYKQLGLVAMLSISVFLSLSFVILPFFNLIVLSIETLLGVIITYLSIFILHVIYMENIKDEYQSGKKFLASFKSGYLKTIPLLIDFFSLTFILSLFGYLLGGGAIKAICSVLLPGTIIGAFVLLLVFNGLIKWYLVLNNHNRKKVNFDKAGAINEK